MKKSDIKLAIKEIVNSVKTAIDNIDEYLQPYEDISVHLEQIQSIEEDAGIDTGIYYDAVSSDILRGCIESSGDIEEITTQFENLIADLESWQYEVSETKADSIQEKYIDILNEIQEGFELDSIECKDDLESQLYDISNQLQGMEL